MARAAVFLVLGVPAFGFWCLTVVMAAIIAQRKKTVAHDTTARHPIDPARPKAPAIRFLGTCLMVVAVLLAIVAGFATYFELTFGQDPLPALLTGSELFIPGLALYLIGDRL